MIYIQTINRYWDPGVKFLENESNLKIKQKFQSYLAEEYIRLVKLCIDTQRFKDKWKDLTPGYLEYKRSHGLSLNIWEATGELKDSLKVYKSGSRNSLIIGIDKRRVHKNSKVKLYMLAKYMEYGTVRTPPRPLFRIVHLYMSSNISFFYEKFLKEGGYSV